MQLAKILSNVWLRGSILLGTSISRPFRMDAGKEEVYQHSDNTIIIGGGVIGLSTAYYLALLQQRNAPYHDDVQNTIFVVESTNSLCPGASGQATGNLGDFGFAPEAEELGKASFALHRQLAHENNGSTAYGYAPLTVWKASTNTSHRTSSNGGIAEEELTRPRWLKANSDWNLSVSASQAHAGHLDPPAFCKFLYQQCKQLGVVFLWDANIETATPQDNLQAFKSVRVSSPGPQNFVNIRCRSILISAGPWSQHVLKKLFPKSIYKLPLNSTNASRNHMQVRNPRWKPEDDQSGVDQVFLGSAIGNNVKLDLTSYPGGTIYVAGAADPQALPKSAESVHPQPGHILAITDLASSVLDLPDGEPVEILSTSRCYRPVAMPNRPIITRLSLHEVYSQVILPRDQQVLGKKSRTGGLFVSTGHNSDGIALAPGSGKAMAEMMHGMEPLVDISGLGL